MRIPEISSPTPWQRPHFGQADLSVPRFLRNYFATHKDASFRLFTLDYTPIDIEEYPAMDGEPAHYQVSTKHEGHTIAVTYDERTFEPLQAWRLGENNNFPLEDPKAKQAIFEAMAEILAWVPTPATA